MAAPIPPDIRRYLQGLLFMAGQQLSRADYVTVLYDLFERLNRFMMQAYLNSLSVSSRTLLERMVAEKRSADELERFIRDHVPDLPQIHADALRAFRRAYLREVLRARDNTHIGENSS